MTTLLSDFVNKLQENKGNKQGENKLFNDILYHLQYTPKLFWEFFDSNTSIDEKKFWWTNQYNAEILFNVLKRGGDAQKLNLYLFENNLIHFIDIKEIRDLANANPENESLNNYLENKDRPEKIDKILELILHNYDSDDFKRVESNLVLFKDKLENFNKITSDKSSTLNLFKNYFNVYLEKGDAEKALNLLNLLKFDYVKVFNKVKLSLLNPKSLSAENIKLLTDFSNARPEGAINWKKIFVGSSKNSFLNFIYQIYYQDKYKPYKDNELSAIINFIQPVIKDLSGNESFYEYVKHESIKKHDEDFERFAFKLERAAFINLVDEKKLNNNTTKFKL